MLITVYALHLVYITDTNTDTDTEIDTVQRPSASHKFDTKPESTPHIGSPQYPFRFLDVFVFLLDLYFGSLQQFSMMQGSG